MMDFFNYRKKILSEKVAKATKKFDKIDPKNIKVGKNIKKKIDDYYRQTGPKDGFGPASEFGFTSELTKRTQEYAKLTKMLEKYQNGKTISGNKSTLLPRDARTNSRRRAKQRGFVLDQRNVQKLLKAANGDLDTIYEIWNMCLFELSSAVKSAELLISPMNTTAGYNKATRTMPSKMAKAQKQLEKMARDLSFDPSDLSDEAKGMIESVNELIDEYNSGLAWFEVKDYEKWIKNGTGDDLSEEIFGAMKSQLDGFIKKVMKPIEKEWNKSLPFYNKLDHTEGWGNYDEENRQLERNKEKMMNHIKRAHAMKLMIEKLVLPEYEKAKKGRR